MGVNILHSFVWAEITRFIMRRTQYVYQIYVFPPFCLGGEVLEREYQADLIKRILRRFESHGTRVQINDPNMPGCQGIPDLTVFVGPRWFLLEVKAAEKSKFRPNQEWWLKKWAEYTDTFVVYPENEEEVLNAMERSLAN